MDQRFVPIAPEAEAVLPPPRTLAGEGLRALLRRYPVWPVVAFLGKKKVPESVLDLLRQQEHITLVRRIQI